MAVCRLDDLVVGPIGLRYVDPSVRLGIGLTPMVHAAIQIAVHDLDRLGTADVIQGTEGSVGITSYDKKKLPEMLEYYVAKG